VKITRISPFSGKENTQELDITMLEHMKWVEGTVIQHAMPRLTADEREFVMTGILPAEWDSMMGEEE
jgi:hypothetical protein